MIVGLDLGASTTDVVLVDGGRIVSKTSRPTTEEKLDEFISSFAGAASIDFIAFTGGASHKLGNRLSSFEVKTVGELDAMAAGARLLTGREKGFAASCGTGTAFVFFDGENVRHLGGTGVGGGTLVGLGALLLDAGVEEIDGLAAAGDSRNIDLSVFDVVGAAVGIAPAYATAANFGKAGKKLYSRNDLARGLVNLVAETIGITASLAAKGAGCNEIVFLGRVASKNPLLKKQLQETLGMFKCVGVFPEDAEYAVAAGAAIAAGRT